MKHIHPKRTHILSANRTCAWLLIPLIAISCTWQSAFADAHQAIWAVKGTHNTVYLMGSVHVLKGVRVELSPAVLTAYSHSPKLVMELDPSTMASDSLGESAAQYQYLPEGQRLRDVLGDELFSKFKTYAQTLGFDVDFMGRFQPWYAATTLQIFANAKQGFDPQQGVEMQFWSKAKADKKSVSGLEKVSDQLRLFGELSMDEQKQYLLSAMREADSTHAQLDRLIAAWQIGDTDTLESALTAAFKQSPDFYHRLVTERNQKWIPSLIQMLNSNEDHLVIVGALHLVGSDGVPELLKRKGYKVTRQ